MKFLLAIFCVSAISAFAGEMAVSGLGESPKANAAAIQRAVDAVAATGGGRVTVPSGTWTTGTFYLKSHVELHLPEGARLVGSADLGDYNPPDAFPQNYGSVSEGWSGRHLILAIGQENVSITGEGVVDGNGKAFFGDKPEVFGDTWWRDGGINARDREHQGRPGQLIEFVECRGVRVEGVRIEDSPCWSCFFYGCDDVVVRGLRIDNPPRHLNTDGIDIDSCRRVSVRDCRISTGDDAIAVRCASARLKDPARICEDVSVENCTLGSSADGIRIGVGTGTIRKVRISNVEINRAGTGFHVQSVFGKSSGVDISDIRFSGSRISGAARAFEIVGASGKRLRDIVVSNVSVEASGLVERSLKVIDQADNVRFQEMKVTVRTTERGLLPMVVGTDRYWAENAALVHTNRSLTLTCPGGTCRLTYDWLPGSVRWHGFDEAVLRVAPAVEGGTVTLALRDEASGKIRQFSRPWTEEIRFPVHDDFKSFCTFSSLSFALPEKGEARTFSILGMDGVHRASAAEAFALEVETGDPVHVLKPGATPVALISNLANVALPLGGCLKVRDFHGRGPDVPLEGTLAAGETRRIPVSLPNRLGIWRINAEFQSYGSVATSSVSCAVLEPRKVTPKWPRDEFRFGVNCHLNHYSEGNRNLCARALVRIGAKLVRCDLFSPKEICPQEGTCDWERHEKLLREMERVGVSVHAIIYGCPPWACWKAGEKGHRHGLTCPMRPGTFEAYCRELAARYGRRIDYYEIGNEWDMVSAKRLPDEQVIAMQHEAMTGLHAGCAEAVCLMNGWASGPLTSIESRRSALHRTMIADHADDYDVYAIHCHGLFKWYAPEIRATLGYFREKGVRKPWYSDESALSSANGNEDEAARTVWKKIVFAWSHGSVDYVWYNLRGSGFNPKDEEHGYGLFTGDFHPRAGAAAFSALAELLGHLRFAELLEDEDERLIAKWTGMRDGRPVAVYVGWDFTSVAPKAVELPTRARKAYAVDLMGNRSPIGLCDGTVNWTPSPEPSAILCELD